MTHTPDLPPRQHVAATTARSLLVLLTEAHQRMDQLGYPRVMRRAS